MGGYLYPQPAPVPPSTTPANPAVELYRYLLSSSERNKLLGILSTGADLLTEKRFSSAEGADMEAAVLLALKVFCYCAFAPLVVCDDLTCADCR